MTGQAGTAEHDHCLRPGCGRKLTSAISRKRGYGHGCWRKIRAAAKAEALAVFTARQVEQARELIEDCALIPSGFDGLCLAVSSDGSEVYHVAAEGCDCPASKDCYHQCAMLMAA
jgi:hypothetical protein